MQRNQMEQRPVEFELVLSCSHQSVLVYIYGCNGNTIENLCRFPLIYKTVVPVADKYISTLKVSVCDIFTV